MGEIFLDSRRAEILLLSVEAVVLCAANARPSSIWDVCIGNQL